MSDHEKRRRGGASWYFNGNGGSRLMSRAAGARKNLERATWTRERLLAMDADFCARLERAFQLGRENRNSASACERPGAGDSAPAS